MARKALLVLACVASCVVLALCADLPASAWPWSGDNSPASSGVQLPDAGTGGTWVQGSDGGISGQPFGTARYTPTDANTFIQWKMGAPPPFLNTGTGPALNLTTGIGASSFLTTAGFFGNLSTNYGVSGNATGICSANTTTDPAGSTLTVSGWVYLEAFSNNFGEFLLKEYRNNGTHNSPYQAFGLAQWSTSDGSWQVSVTTSATSHGLSVLNPLWQIPSRQWTHLAMTYDGATLSAYFNGALAGALAVTGTIDFGTDGPYCVGVTQINSNATTGQLADWRIETVVRSQSYLRSMASNGLSLPLVAGF